MLTARRKLTRASGKLLRSNPYMAFFYVVVVVFMLYWSIRSLATLMKLDGYLVPISLIDQSMLYAVIGYGAFLFLSYELFVSIDTSAVLERLESLPQGLERSYAAMLRMLSLCVLPYFLLHLSITLTMCIISGKAGYIPFLINLLLAETLYFLVLPLIGILLGAAMAVWLAKKRVLVYLLSALLVLLSTSYLDEMFYIIPSSPGITDMLYRIRDFFSLVPIGVKPTQGGLLMPIFDPIYATPVELPRWCLAVFWLGGLGLLLFLRAPGALRRRRGLTCATGALMALSLFGFVAQGCLPRHDGRPSGPGEHIMSYYNRSPVPSDRAPYFTIESYDLSFTILNQLHAVADMRVSGLSRGMQTYKFALYHEFKVSGVWDGQGNKIPFSREGDYVEVERAHVGDDGRIRIAYSGHSQRYYTNMQAICLPGYFPYYPTEDNKRVWRGALGNWDTPGIDTSISDTEKDFRVRVISPLNVISNVDGGGGNRFEGRARSLTLLSGMIRRDGEHDIYYLPLAASAGGEGIVTYQLLESVANTLNKDGQLTGGASDVIDLRNLAVFPLPPNLRLGSQSEYIVFMDGYLLVCDYVTESSLLEKVLQKYMPPLDHSTSEIGRVFSEYISYFRDDGEERVAMTATSLLQGITEAMKERMDYEVLMSLSDEEYMSLPDGVRMAAIEKEIQASSRLRNELYPNAMIYLCEQSTIRGEVIGEIYRFLYTAGEDADSDRFLVELLEKDIANGGK